MSRCTEHLAGTETQLNNQVRSLLEATRNAAGTTRAINRIQTELRNEEYALSLLPDRPNELTGLRNLVDEVARTHSQSISELEKLSDRLGLTAIKLPDGVPVDEQRFLKALIALQVQKQLLWMNLQSYQDEHAPIRLSSTRGGRTGNLGTGKLSNISKSLKTKTQQVKSTCTKFNSVISDLEAMTRPEWIPEGLVPAKVELQKLLRLSQDDPLWDEIFSGTPWFNDFESPSTSTTIPAYAKSKVIREGITAALLLERIEEQITRLQIECVNVVNEWTHQTLTILNCRESNNDGFLHHRMDLEARRLAHSRPNHANTNAEGILWTLDTNALTKLICNQSRSEVISEVQQNPAASVTTALSNLTGLLQMPKGFSFNEDDNEISNDSDEDKTSDDESEGGLVDKEEEAKGINRIYNNLVDKDIDQLASVYLPSALSLIGRVDGNELQTRALENVRQMNDDSGQLPSLRVLMDTVDGRMDKSTPVFNFFGEGIQPSLTRGLDKVLLRNSRFYEDGSEITHEMLKTLDDGKYIHVELVTILALIIHKDIKENSLTIATPLSLRPSCSLVHLNWLNVSDQTIKMAFDKVRQRTDSAFLTYDSHTTPRLTSLRHGFFLYH
jgi:hypothetical protein